MTLILAMGFFMSFSLVPAMHNSLTEAELARCEANLRQVGSLLRVFAAEHDGAWPLLDTEYNFLSFRLDALYPDYLTTYGPLVCPGSSYYITEADIEAGYTAASYYYLGYAITNETEGLAFLEAYQKRMEQGLLMNEDLNVRAGTGNGGGNVLYRLHQRVEVFELADPARVVVMMDNTPYYHEPPGGHVLYLNGQVEFRRWGEFPFTDTFIDALHEFETWAGDNYLSL